MQCWNRTNKAGGKYVACSGGSKKATPKSAPKAKPKPVAAPVRRQPQAAQSIFDKPPSRPAFKPAKKVAAPPKRAAFATKDTSTMGFLQFKSYVNALLVSQGKKKLSSEATSRAWKKEKDRREIQTGTKRRSGELKVLARERKAEAMEAQQKRKAAAAAARSARRKGPKMPPSNLPKIPKKKKDIF